MTSPLHQLTLFHWLVAALLILFSSLSIWVNYRDPTSRGGRALLLAVTSVLLFVIFSVRPLRLNPLLAEPASKPAEYTRRAFELIEVEHAKAIDEIKLHMEQEDQWFHNKFLLLGSLFATLLTYMAFAGVKEDKTEGDPLLENRLGELVRSSSVCSILALACTISLAIDIHIRNHIIVVQQLGNWIAHYVEPALLRASPDRMSAGGFLPWEQFLRLQGSGAGMHHDDLYGFAFYPHLHFLTWILYLIYLASLLSLTQRSRGPEQARIVFSGFLLVHFSLAALTWVGNAAPAAFQSKVIPYVDWWASGLVSPAFYLCFWLLLIVNLSPQLRCMWMQCDWKATTS